MCKPLKSVNCMLKIYLKLYSDCEWVLSNKLNLIFMVYSNKISSSIKAVKYMNHTTK